MFFVVDPIKVPYEAYSFEINLNFKPVSLFSKGPKEDAQKKLTLNLFLKHR